MEHPPNKTTIGCNWVYRIQQKTNKDTERYKPWVVAKDYIQHEGIDYMEMYSPVARLAMIHTIFAVTTIMNWHLEQLNVKTALLHALSLRRHIKYVV